MKTILISTIIRNRKRFLNNWRNQIESLVRYDANNNYYLSVYENDSNDGTQDHLKTLDFSFLKGYKIQNEILNTPSFGSVINEQRVKFLAEARNKSIYNNDFLDTCSHLLVIEPDIDYSSERMVDMIINNNEYDIISARSTNYGSELYDDWATRKNPEDKRWNTHIYGIPKEGVINVWSTFNCFVLYNAKPIKNNITFNFFNKRLNHFDCDTAVICENFRENGYNNIVMNASETIFHYESNAILKK